MRATSVTKKLQYVSNGSIVLGSFRAIQGDIFQSAILLLTSLVNNNIADFSYVMPA